MGNRQIFRIIFISFILIFISSCEDKYKKGYDSGYSDGYTEGNSNGYNRGYNQGYNIGHQEGHSQGHQEGHQEGYISGESEGYIEGTKFILTESITPTLAGYLIVLALLTWTFLAFKYLKKPVVDFITSFTDSVDEKRTKQKVKKDIIRKTKALPEIEKIKIQSSIINEVGKYSNEEIKAIQTDEFNKLKRKAFIKIQETKNKNINDLVKEYEKLIKNIELAQNLTNKERAFLYKKTNNKFNKEMDNL